MSSRVHIVAEPSVKSALLRAVRSAGVDATWATADAPPPVGRSLRLLVVDVAADVGIATHVSRLRALPVFAEVPLLLIVGAGRVDQLGRVADLADFCLRPVVEGELALRVRRALGDPQDDNAIRCGELVVDPDAFEARLDTRPLDLTYQEFRLLAFLVGHTGRAFSRDQLLSRVWGHDYYGGSRTVDIHIRRLRAKLGQPYASYIQTIRHLGYKWAQPDRDVRAPQGDTPHE